MLRRCVSIFHHFVIFRLTALALVLSVPLSAMADLPKVGNDEFSVIGLALHGTLQYPSGRDSNIQGMSLSLLDTYRHNMSGLSVGLGVQSSFEIMNGAQISLVGNEAEEVNGIQLGGIGNINGRFNGVVIAGWMNIGAIRSTSYGVQIAGLGNTDSLFRISRDPNTSAERDVGLVGGQIALLANRKDDCITGFQIAAFNFGDLQCNGLQLGLSNKADILYGLQLGLLNRAGRLSGLQVGVVNLAHAGSGVQIGLVNTFGNGNDNYRSLPLVNWRF
ncbi:MAG: hypothetical protein FWG50_06365 [Kiritimatiellaeota bacterium]|nr:hypothetical protein [Kiritimatiellota bacterium]